MARRVLFINEFGSGLTHFNALVGAFRHMKKHADIEARFYVKAVDELQAQGFNEAPFEAPPHRALHKNKKQFKGRTFGEEMFGEIFVLRDQPDFWFGTWDKIFSEFNPHLVVLDYAPVAQMVAFGRWPTISIGYGYTMPPAAMPRFVAFGQEAPKPKDERMMLEQFQAQLAKLGINRLTKFTDICAVDTEVNATVPPFDPYIEHRAQDSYAGLHHPGGSPWPTSQAEGAMAYFHAFSQDDNDLLAGLKSAGVATDFYAGPPKDTLLAKFAGSHVTVHSAPLRLKETLPGKAVCIHMGGQGVALAALFAGVPQVMLHTHRENAFNARIIAMKGAGIAHPMRAIDRKSLPSLILEAANDPNMRQKAFEMGRLLSKYRDADPIGVLAREALQMTGGS
ncbi:MAG: hypothetical protein LCH46_04320 [Proteobacteria bacterium]|nr:hypothetical protein [Pseudomonadota bacterium]